ncbi:MAG: phosphatidate cytidylyltransferase [Chloroflexota bacterium]|nr:phosphatidate cytidylyltransferase [Chloroflexota bacterium]
MLWQRVVSALVILPIVFAATYFGDPWFSLLGEAIMFLGLFEFYRLAESKGRKPSDLLGIFCAVLLISFAHLGAIFLWLLLWGIVIFTGLWIVLRFFIFHHRIGKPLADWGWTLGGVVYLGLLLGYLILLRRSFGWEWTLLAILTVSAVDTSAYFVGRAWGRHRLAPKISPKKTCEGAVGGLVGGLAAAVMLAFAFGLMGEADLLNASIELWQVILLGVLIAVVSQLGDFTESMLKRSAGVKDAGGLIPGHGGILDRVDSVVFIGVLVYYYLRWAL